MLLHMLIKSTLKLSLVLIADHILSLVLAFFVTAALAATGIVNNETSRIVIVLVAVFTGIMHCILIYASAAREGERDHNRTQYKHMKEFKLKGTVAACIALIPVLFFYFCIIIKNNIMSQNDFLFMFKMVCWQYNGFILALSEIAYPLTGLVLFIPVTAVTLGYLAGYHDIRLLDKIVYVKDKRDK